MEFAWEQICIFLRAIAVGAGIMVCYDFFRILRTAFRTSDAVVFLEDVVFFVAAGLATWFYLLESCRGELRGFVMVGEVIGGLLYFLTAGRLVMKAAKPVIHFLQRLIDRLIFRPVRRIWKLLKGIYKWLAGLGKRISKRLAVFFGADKLRKLSRNKKNLKKNSKIHLQEGHNLLYNLYVKLFPWLFLKGTSQSGNQTQEVEK